MSVCHVCQFVMCVSVLVCQCVGVSVCWCASVLVCQCVGVHVSVRMASSKKRKCYLEGYRSSIQDEGKVCQCTLHLPLIF